jgi:hypothetical protein
MNVTTDPIEFAVDSLERTLAKREVGPKQGWTAQLDHIMVGIKQAARQRDATLNSGEGNLVDVDSPLLPSPGMDRLTDRLHDELASILEEVASVRSEVQSKAVSVTPKLSAIYDRVARLLETLKHYERDETAAVLEIVNRDIGGES